MLGRVIAAVTVIASLTLGLGGSASHENHPTYLNGAHFVAHSTFVPLGQHFVGYAVVPGHPGNFAAVTTGGRVEFVGSPSACRALLGPGANCVPGPSGLAPGRQITVPAGTKVIGIAVTWDGRGYWVLAHNRGWPLDFGDAAIYRYLGMLQGASSPADPHPAVPTTTGVYQWAATSRPGYGPTKVDTEYVVRYSSGRTISVVQSTTFSY